MAIDYEEGMHLRCKVDGCDYKQYDEYTVRRYMYDNPNDDPEDMTYICSACQDALNNARERSEDED